MARHFNGSSDFLDAGTNVRGTDLLGILVMCWVNPDAVTNGKVVARWGTGVTEQWLLSLNADNTAAFLTLDGGLTGHQVNTTSACPTGSWTHIAGMWDGTNITAYFNGALQGTVAVGSLNLNVAGTHVFMGKAGDGGPFYGGGLAEVSIILVNTGVTATRNYQAVIKSHAQTAAVREMDGMYDTEMIDNWPLLGDATEPGYGGGHDNATVTGTTVIRHPPVSTILSHGRARAQTTGSGVA